MPLTANKFLTEIQPTIKGWLYPGAVEVSEALLGAQRTLNVGGGGLEIGVYQGAYLSFLSGASDRPWAGLDVFMFDQKEIAQSNIDRVLKETGSKSKVKLIQANTQTLDDKSFSDLLASAGIETLSFASIDGDHSAEGVYHDMKLVEPKMAPGGIIALDDIFSAMSGSVTEGMFRYMFGETNLRPVVFSDNKLFLTTRGYEELYQIKLQIAFGDAPGVCGDRWRAPGQINRLRPFLGSRLMHL